MIRTLITSIIIILLTSCTKEVEIDFPSEESLALTSIFTPKEPFAFYHTTTTSITDNYEDSSTLYQLKLFRDKELILDTNLISEKFTSNIYPSAGKTYTTQLIKEGFPTLIGTDSIPLSAPQIIAVTAGELPPATPINHRW